MNTVSVVDRNVWWDTNLRSFNQLILYDFGIWWIHVVSLLLRLNKIRFNRDGNETPVGDMPEAHTLSQADAYGATCDIQFRIASTP